MHDEDLEVILEIERLSSKRAFSRMLLESELKQEQAHILVARSGEEIIGYIDFWTVLDEIHLINITVHPEFRRQQVATRLFYFMIDSYPKIKTIYLEVRASNQIAKNFYQKIGFEIIGHRKEYYADKENAVEMMLKR